MYLVCKTRKMVQYATCIEKFSMKREHEAYYGKYMFGCY
jgi:hypothetical protein